MLVEHFPVGPLQCNCVILADPQTRSAFVVDPGDDVDRILAVLARHNLRVGGILATHAHIDHVGGLASLARQTGAPTLLHEADLPLYQALAEQARWLGVPVPDVGSIDRITCACCTRRATPRAASASSSTTNGPSCSRGTRSSRGASAARTCGEVR
jgi:glyoxylase-like metal-dependent hydrolase (beta-lactamase superfamily II)